MLLCTHKYTKSIVKLQKEVGMAVPRSMKTRVVEISIRQGATYSLLSCNWVDKKKMWDAPSLLFISTTLVCILPSLFNSIINFYECSGPDYDNRIAMVEAHKVLLLLKCGC